jgi:hypothetical protein
MNATPVVIGQDNPFVKAIEQGLIAVGVKVAETSLAASQPWTTLPIISWLVDSGIKFAITEIMTEVDQIGYQIYVSLKDAAQVSQYIAAQASENQSDIDKSADALIGFQNE